MVAEKPSIALAIAKVLARGHVRFVDPYLATGHFYLAHRTSEMLFYLDS
jgi:hypothetical protein